MGNVSSSPGAELLARQGRVVAITGSQGSGKSTLAKILVRQLNDLGKSAACVSLDDFYLPKQDRIELGRRVHPLLVTRGVPGTHDSGRLGQVLKQVASSSGRWICSCRNLIKVWMIAWQTLRQQRSYW